MEFYELDAMFTFTCAAGFTAFVMCLVMLGIVLKAWAMKIEKQAQHNRSDFVGGQSTPVEN